MSTELNLRRVSLHLSLISLSPCTIGFATAFIVVFRLWLSSGRNSAGEQFKGLIPVPPVRERREDVPLLVRYFVDKFARRTDKEIEIIEPETMDALLNYDWPENVGQLESFIQRSVILTDGPKLRAPLDKL